ncbi:MAG: hypothetical protein O9289_05920 [Rhodobacteraceae bacterium]|jgi:hypothetical protein|nr:hypothetical protein [Paracoccaceae bacterium]MCZ8082724.1 hypothetical protein [Paracoccaceae bacterium]
MKQFTIVPDIHADADRLRRSLVAATPSSQLAFLGDLIDAGHNTTTPSDRQVLSDVRSLVDSGRAVSVMGNHELNAILFHRNDHLGRPLRSREPKNAKQHKSFCDAFGVGTDEALAWTEWFLGLPLWLDLGELRLVHACWDRAAIETIAERRPDARLRAEDLEEVAAKQTPFAQAVNLLLTGPELKLPDGVSFHDKGGHARHHARIAWWRSNEKTWRRASLSVPNPNELPDAEIEMIDGVEFYGEGEPPVIVGHYKMLGTPAIESANAACLDYPNCPCIYEWNGESQLLDESVIKV